MRDWRGLLYGIAVSLIVQIAFTAGMSAAKGNLTEAARWGWQFGISLISTVVITLLASWYHDRKMKPPASIDPTLDYKQAKRM